LEALFYCVTLICLSVKHFTLSALLIGFSVSAHAQHIQVGVKATAGYSLLSSTEEQARSGSTMGPGGTYYTLSKFQPYYTYRFSPKPRGSLALTAHAQGSGRWGWGAELQVSYQAFEVEQRFSPEKAGHDEYQRASTGQIPPVGYYWRDSTGAIIGNNSDGGFSPIFSGEIVSRAELPTSHRYTMLQLELPLYVTYAVAERWRLQGGLAPSLLLDNQVRITARYPSVESGQLEIRDAQQKQADPALRRLNWRLVAGAEFQLTPATAVSLNLRPSLSNIFNTKNSNELMVPYSIRQHTVSLGVTHIFSSLGH
jgi:hypothetical protein